MTKKPKAEQPEQEQKPISSKGRTALLRYMAVLFAAAFLLVLLSYLIQLRNNRNTISELTETSSSALANAEALQDSNQYLIEQNESLQEQVSSLQDEADEAEDGRKAAEEKAADLQDELDAALAENAELTDRNTELQTQLEENASAAETAQTVADLLVKASNELLAGDYDAVSSTLAELDARVAEGAALSQNQQSLYDTLKTAAAARSADTAETD